MVQTARTAFLFAPLTIFVMMPARRGPASANIAPKNEKRIGEKPIQYSAASMSLQRYDIADAINGRIRRDAAKKTADLTFV